MELVVTRAQAHAAACVLARLADEADGSINLLSALSEAGLDLAVPQRGEDAADMTLSDAASSRLAARYAPPYLPIWVRLQLGAALADTGIQTFRKWAAEGRVVVRWVDGVQLVLVESIYELRADPPERARRGRKRKVANGTPSGAPIRSIATDPMRACRPGTRRCRQTFDDGG